jgi:hypothetical protein
LRVSRGRLLKTHIPSSPRAVVMVMIVQIPVRTAIDRRRFHMGLISWGRAEAGAGAEAASSEPPGGAVKTVQGPRAGPVGP